MDCRETCCEIHRLLESLPAYSSPHEVPFTDGLYFMYEAGETSEHAPRGRIVRVGSHLVKGGLVRRLRQHYSGRKNGSVLRRLLGGALIRRANPQSPCLTPEPGKGHWEQQGAETCSDCENIEAKVSTLLASSFRFRCVEIQNPEERNRFEASLVATLATCPVCEPSQDWLGLYAYPNKVHKSGLWNNKLVDGLTLKQEDLNSFVEHVARTAGGTPSANPDNAADEPTKVDTAVSDACTRSGAFALLLSVVLFLLIPSWAQRKDEIALGRYLTHRVNLSLSLGALDDNPYWQKLVESKAAADSLSLEQLLDVRAETSTIPPDTDRARPKRATTSDTGARPAGTPAPPTGVTVSVRTEIPATRRIVDSFRKLNDSNLLTDTRRYSNLYDISVARWAQKRVYLAYRNVVADGCSTKELETSHANRESDVFVPSINNEVLLKCFTLRDVRELAQFEQPTIPDSIQTGGHAGKDINLTLSSLPRNLGAASAFLHALLFFVITYFAAFAREAISSTRFPAQGTLFHAFSRSGWTLSMLFLALCSPLIASLALAVMAGEWWLWACSALILCAVWSVYLALQQRSYFGALNPRNWIRPRVNGPSSHSETDE